MAKYKARVKKRGKTLDVRSTSAERSRPDPRQIRTRQALLAAGQDLFSAHGPDNVSIDDLILAAGISKQSFYNHFLSKDELAREVLHLARSEIEAIVEQVNHGEVDPAKRVARGLCVHARRAIDAPAHGRLIARMLIQDASINMDLNRGVVADVSNGLAQGRLAVFTLETGVGFVAAVAQALVARVLLNNDIATAVTVSQQYVTLSLRALGLPPIEAELIAAQAADQTIRQGLAKYLAPNLAG